MCVIKFAYNFLAIKFLKFLSWIFRSVREQRKHRFSIILLGEKISIALSTDKFVCTTFLTKCEVSTRQSWDIGYSAIRRNTTLCLLSKQLSSATNDPLGSQSTSDQSRQNIVRSLRRRPLVLKIYI